MKYHPGQKVRVAKQGIRYKGHNYVGMLGRVVQASEYGYHVVLDSSNEELTFFEDELELA